MLTKYELENRDTNGEIIREIGNSSRPFLTDLIQHIIYKLNSDKNRPVDLELSVKIRELK